MRLLPTAWPILTRLQALLVVATLLAIGLVGGLRLETETDITALLPRQDAGTRSLLGLAREAGLMRKVVVVVGPAAEPGAPALFAAARDLEAQLARLPGVARVQGTVRLEEIQSAARLILARAPRLVPADAPELDEAELTSRLTQLRDRLASPEGLALGAELMADPLGLGRHALGGLEAAGQGLGAAIEAGRLVSTDRRRALLVVELAFDPLDVLRARDFVERLDATVAEVGRRHGLEAFALGGAHFAAASAADMMRDVGLAFGLSTLGVLVIAWLFFRRLRLLPAALLPGGVGLAVACGVLGLSGIRVHALTLGFASTLAGISIDYSIHLLLRARQENGATSHERMARALGAVAKPISLGALTTVGAFALVATSGFVGIRQLAVFSCLAVPVAWLVTLTVLPAFHALLLGAAPDAGARSGWLDTPTTPRARRVLTLGLALFVGAALLGVGQVALSGDPRAMGHTPPGLAAREATLKRIFPGLSDQALIVSSAADRERALAAAERLRAALIVAGIPDRAVVSPVAVLPGRASQEASLARVRKLFTQHRDRVERAFANAGFNPEVAAELLARPDPPPLVPEDYRGTALATLVDDAVRFADGRWHVLTRVQASDDAAIDRLARVASGIPGAKLVSERLEARTTLVTLQGELTRLLLTWAAVAFLLLLAVERSFAFALRAALPPACGVLAAVGLFGLAGRPLTPVAAAGLTLVLGLGVDYGIFVASRRPTERLGPLGHAILASALTTLAGFGVLAFARTRAMADLGLIILAGVAAAVVVALVVLPAWTRRPEGPT